MFKFISLYISFKSVIIYIAKCDTSGMITIGSEQFKLFTDIVKTWAGAKTICSDEGLVMAEPQDPPTVVGYLWDTYYSKPRVVHAIIKGPSYNAAGSLIFKIL